MWRGRGMLFLQIRAVGSQLSDLQKVGSRLCSRAWGPSLGMLSPVESLDVSGICRPVLLCRLWTPA